MDLSVFDGGSGTEYISYKAQETPHWKIDGVSADLKKFLLDPQSLKTGWGKLASGEAPHWVWAEIAGTTIEKPTDNHNPASDYKPAFQLMLMLNAKNGSPVDGWREWSTNQAGARHAIKWLWPDIDSGAKENPGKSAGIEITGYEGQKFGPATVTIPVFAIAGWVDTPAQADAPAPAPEPVAQSENVF